jgi:hypothetical protein
MSLHKDRQLVTILIVLAFTVIMGYSIWEKFLTWWHGL